MDRPDLPNPVAVANNQLVRLAQIAKINTCLPVHGQFAERPSNVFALPEHRQTDLTAQRRRLLAIAPLIGGLAASVSLKSVDIAAYPTS